MLKKINMLCLAPSFLFVVCGCKSTESRREFQERQKVEADINAVVDALHACISRIDERYQSFDLVSQPYSKSSSPGEVFVERSWVIASTGSSPEDDSKASIIEASRVMLKKQVMSENDNLDYETSVEDEGERIRINVNARWNRKSE